MSKALYDSRRSLIFRAVAALQQVHRASLLDAPWLPYFCLPAAIDLIQSLKPSIHLHRQAMTWVSATPGVLPSNSTASPCTTPRRCSTTSPLTPKSRMCGRTLGSIKADARMAQSKICRGPDWTYFVWDGWMGRLEAMDAPCI
jgi:hypothetical protein